MNDTNVFFWGFIFGAIGLGYLTYGIRQKKAVPLVCGLVLGGFSYFVTGLVSMFILGAVFMALPFVVGRGR